MDSERDEYTHGGGDANDVDKTDHSQRGADSEDELPAPEDDDDKHSQEDRSDVEDHPLGLNPWTWSQEINDEKVDSWGVKDAIKEDPCSTAPVRAKWMYEARKQGRTLCIESH